MDFYGYNFSRSKNSTRNRNGSWCWIFSCKKLLSRGYFVIAVRVDETEKQIDALQSSYPDQMAIVCADIGSDESVLKASNNIKNLTDHIDLLINCAGSLVT